MIVVHVQHFLDEEGQRRFPAWLDEVSRALGGFEGFVSIRRIVPLEAPGECHLLLEFERLALLRRWASSATHDELLARLAPYRQRKHHSTIFRVGEGG